MSVSRLTFSLESGGLPLPAAGRIAVIGPPAGMDLSTLPHDRIDIIHTGAAETEWWQARGLPCSLTPTPPYEMALVCVPRARERAMGWIAMACEIAGSGLVVVDGGKTDGIESLLRAVKDRVPVTGQVSKAHGKCFWFDADDRLADWALPAPAPDAEGHVTAPGVFSADGVDPGSALLADHLPKTLGAEVADLGAGWGYLSSRILQVARPKTLHLVENDHIALDCARRNVTDPAARFHWADATVWTPPAALDAVVMNPPFHTGRKAEPALGRAFIMAAARVLKPSGQVWLVANRHLPYEATLGGLFAQAAEVAGNTRFKILHAARPLRQRP